MIASVGGEVEAASQELVKKIQGAYLEGAKGKAKAGASLTK